MKPETPPSDKKITFSDRIQAVISKRRGLVLSGSPIFIVLVFAFILRIYKIGSVGVSGRELENIDRILSFSDISNLIKGDVSTNLYYFLQYLWGGVSGYSLFSMRLFSVILSIIGLYIFYKFTEQWFSRRLAQIATFLFSISSFHILLSRSISHEIIYPVVSLSALFFLTLAYRQKSRLYFFISGIFIGLGLYASEATLALGFAFIAAGGYFFYKNKKFITSFVTEKIVAIVTILIVSIPFFIAIVTGQSGFFSRFTISPVVIANNIYTLFTSLTFSTPFDFMYNVGSKRIFDPFILLTFLAGLIYIIYGIKRRKFYFLFVWLFTLSLVIIFEKNFSLGTIVYIAPVIFILSALIQEFILQKWFQTFPFNRLAGLTMIVGVGFFYALSMSYNLEKVFLAWMKFPDRKYVYNVQPLKVDLKKEKVYLYNEDIPNRVIKVIFGIKSRGQLVRTESPNSIAKGEKVNIITSNQGAEIVKESLKEGNQVSLGQNIVLFKGERK